jgi:hypothetical protein
MRITESQLRRIIREELLHEGVEGPLLPPGVTPEMVAEDFARNCLYALSFETRDELFGRFMKEAPRLGVTEQRVHELVDLLFECADARETYGQPTSLRLVATRLRLAFGEGLDHLDENPLKQEIMETWESNRRDASGAVITIAFLGLTTPMGPPLASLLKAISTLTPEGLERRIAFLRAYDHIRSLALSDDLDPDLREKLARMAFSGIDGLIQASEIAKMLA